jgi:predicted RNA binding protein YcfA (HicA-like mRNA interferase family)
MPMSGKEMLRLYELKGWRRLRQKGSHLTVFKQGEGTETIPMHKELSTGMERKLLKRIKDKK